MKICQNGCQWRPYWIRHLHNLCEKYRIVYILPCTLILWTKTHEKY